MDQTDDIILSKSTKILFNLIEIRLFDLSQVLQVGGHKLSINQIKQALQKQYNIFGQVQKIFDQLKIRKLYDLIKQVSQNYVSIASILIDEKSPKNTLTKNKGVNQQTNQEEIPQSKFQKIDKSSQKSKNSPRQPNRKREILKTQESIKSVQQINKTLQSLKAQQFQLRNKLGGIYLFNENYKRGVETLQQKHEAWQQKKRKKYGQKQLILELISKQISDQADVQKLYDNDEISKFIREGKVKHELYTHIDYQKDLESISSFLKQSQDDAMKFLMDTKKTKQDNDQKNSEDEMVVNYHELVQMLVQRKKSQYKAVENKIKQIVETFKYKLETMQNQLILKQTKVRQLQYKLKKKQGTEVGSQTVGLRSRFTKNSPDEIEQLEEQHKAVVELLKKNLDENQKEILILQTDVKITGQKLKKKEQQTTDLNVEIQRLKKQLKQQKQKFYNQNINNNAIDQAQNPIDTIVQSPEIQQNQQIQVSQGKVSSSHKKRKPKHSFFAMHTNTLSSAPRLVKPMDQDTNVKQNGLVQNDKPSFANFQASKNSSFYNKKKSYLNSENNENDRYYQPERDQVQVSEEGFTQNSNETNNVAQDQNQKDFISKQQFQEFKKTSQQQKNFTRQSSKHTTKYSQARKQQKNLTNKSFKNSNKFVQSTKKETTKDRVQNKNVLEKQINLHRQQKGYKYNSSKIQMNRMPQSINKLSQKPVRNLQNKSLYSIKNNSEKASQKINQANPRETLVLNYQQKIIDYDELLQSNSQKIYELLFRSISSVQEKYNVQEKQIQQLQGYLKKYNQSELYRRLKDIFDLLNLAYQDNGVNSSSFKKETYEQEDIPRNSYKDSLQSSKAQSKKLTLNLPQFNGKPEKYSNSPTLRNKKSNTDIDKSVKERSIEPQKNKQIKNLTKDMIAKKLFKQIQNQIRISGKGFDLTKKQFYQLCKNINLDQSARVSQNSSDSSQCQEQNYVTIKSQKLNVSHKIKSYKNISKDKSIVKDPNFQKNQKLKIQGTGMDYQQQEEIQKQKINNFNGHLRKQSQSMRNLFKSQDICQSNQNENIIKAQKLEKIKKSTSDHFLNGAQNVFEALNQEPNTQQFKVEKKRHIQNLYKALKKQGTKIQTLKKLEEVIQSNKISLKDLLKITAIVSSQKTQDLSRILNKDCNQSCKIFNKSLGQSKSCCNHIKKMNTFLQKLSVNQNWLKKIKKQVFAMHILNIDGGDEHKTDFHKKKLQKQKSIARMNLTANNSQTILKSIQTETFYSSSKKNQQITNNRQNLKKNILTSHIELKERKPYFQTKNKPKNVDSLSFLPQLANKPTSQSIKN